MFKSFSLLEINYVNIPVQLSDNSFLFFSSRTRTTGFPCCTQPRIPQPHPSRSTKTCLRRKTRTNSLITCRTSDFSVKGFCVMMETEKHPPWTGTLEAIFMKTFWEQLYSFFVNTVLHIPYLFICQVSKNRVHTEHRNEHLPSQTEHTCWFARCCLETDRF